MSRFALHGALLAWLLFSSTERALADAAISMTNPVPGTIGADAFNYNQWLANSIRLDEYAAPQRPDTVTLLMDVVHATPFLRVYILEDLGGKPGKDNVLATLEPASQVASGTNGVQLVFTMPTDSEAIFTPGKRYWIAAGVDGINYNADAGQQLGLLDWSYASTNITTNDGWTVDDWIAVSNTNGAEWAASRGLPYVFGMTTIIVPEPSRTFLLLTGMMILLTRRSRTGTRLALTVLPLLFISCEKKPEPVPGNVLATVGRETITTEDFQAAAARRGGGNPASVDRQALMEELVTESALVQRAQAQGLDQTPEFRRRMRTLLIALLRENEPPATAQATPSKEQLTALYEEMKPRLVTPAARHLAILQLTADSTGTLPATVAKLQEAVQRFKALPSDPARRGFGPIAAEYSEQQDTRYAGGDLGWLTDEDINRRLPAGPAEAALALTTPGQCSDVITTGSTAFVVLLAEKRTATAPAFEQAEKQIKAEFDRRSAATAKANELKAIRQGLEIHIDEERLRSLELSTRLPSADSLNTPPSPR